MKPQNWKEPELTQRITLSKSISGTYSSTNIKKIFQNVVSYPNNERERRAKEILEIVQNSNTELEAMKTLNL